MTLNEMLPIAESLQQTGGEVENEWSCRRATKSPFMSGDIFESSKETGKESRERTE